VRKRPGKESTPLLDAVGSRAAAEAPSKKSGGLWASMKRNLFGGSSAVRSSDSDAIIDPVGSLPSSADDGLPTYHIFSLASGHLYERFLKVGC
jgi:hypothetical protein